MEDKSYRQYRFNKSSYRILRNQPQFCRSCYKSPVQDIPLAAVLSSSIGGFTNSELMLIRGNVEEKCSFYDACISYIEKHDEDEIKTKLERFFTMIRELEECKNYTGIDSLIDIYISALPNGNIRIANINMLMKKAEEFEKNSFNGLFNFLRYIEKCRYHDIDFAEAQMDTGSDDKVQITTIHKSKGLEYPVVFLVGLGRQFNQMDEKKDVYVISIAGGVRAAVASLSEDKCRRLPAIIKETIDELESCAE